jgi:hypothetical protein
VKSSNTTCCLKFEKKSLKIFVINNQSNKALWQKILPSDFDILDNAGLVINPIKTASFLQKSADELGLPKKVRVSLSLEFVSLSRLALPAVSGPDFDRMIIDEAERESPFSFTDEKIAVVYQVSREKTVINGVSGTEVWAVTTPKSLIDKINEVFQNTDLTLEAVTPSILGIKEYLIQQRIKTTQPFALVSVSSGDAEFYVWKGEFASSIHFIRSGAAVPEELNKEIITSLENFNRNASGDPISQVVIVGENCRLELDSSEYNVKYLSGDEGPDLVGLACLPKIPANLSFINQTTRETSATTRVNKVWPYLIGGIVLINVLIGWSLWGDKHRLAQVKTENEQLRNELNSQLIQLQNESRVAAHDYKTHLLLERIRKVVSANMMFERLVLDLETKNMQLEGFCLGQNTINEFILDLSIMKGVRSVEGIKVIEQARGDIKGYVFSLQVILEEI